MDEEKANALLKWVNTMEMGKQTNSLKQLSSGLLLEIVYYIDKEYELAEEPNNDHSNALDKVISYLESFYQQSIKSFIDENEITNENILEIGKVLSLLLYCAIQGDNVSDVVDKITKMSEDIQMQIKIVIEAVLKEVNCGQITMMNITNVLGQSDSEIEHHEFIEKSEYHSSPIISISSPVLQLKSPMKALMASPQMQSRQSKATISKLCKKLNELQMKVNAQQLTQSSLENTLEEKNQQIEHQDQKISSLSKEVTRIGGLEEEIQSLCCFEKELTDVKSECERLKRKIQELQKCKQDFLIVEKDLSDYVSENSVKTKALEDKMKEVEKRSRDRILDLESSLEEEHMNNKRMRTLLLEASAGETASKEKLKQLRAAYEEELGNIKASLHESGRREHKLRQEKEEEVLRQISRENELKNCYKDKERNLKDAADQLLLENMQLQQNIAAKEKVRRNVESDLKKLEDQLRDANSILDEEKRLFKVKDEEISRFKNELKEKELELERLETSIKEKEQEILQEFMKKEKLLENSRNLGAKVEYEQERNAEILRESERLESCIHTSDEEKAVLMKDNLSLKENVKKLDVLSRECEYVQICLKSSCEEKEILMKENMAMQEEIKQINLTASNNEETIDALRKKNQDFKSKLTTATCTLNALRDQLNETRNLFGIQRKEIKIIHDESGRREHKLRQEKEEEVLRQISRENELKNCYKDKERNLKDAADQLLLENMQLQQNIAAKEKVKDEEISKFKNELKEKELELERLETSIKEKEQEILQEFMKKEKLLENSRNLVAKVEYEQERNAEILRESERLESCIHTSDEEKKAVLMKDNLSLKENVKKLDVLSRECEYVQICLKSSCEEKEILMKENMAMQEEIKQINLTASNNEETIDALRKKNQDFKSKLTTATCTLNALRDQLNETRNLFGIQRKEIKIIHDESGRREHKLRQEKEEEVLRQISRENELKNCYKEKERNLKDAADQLLLENMQLQQNIAEKEKVRRNVESDLKKLEDQLRDANSILDEEKRLFKVKDEEISKFKNELKEKELELERLETSIKEKEQEILQEFMKKEKLLENSRNLVAKVEYEQERNAEILRESERLESCIHTSDEEKAVLMKDNLSLKENVKKLDVLSRECEYVQICLKSSCEEKEILMKENMAMQEEIKQINLTASNNEETIDALRKKNQDFKSKLTTATCTLNALRDQLKETRNLFGIQRKEIKIIHADFKDCCVKLIDQQQKEKKEQTLKLKFIENENLRFKEHVSKLEEGVDDLEQILIEEQFISKRLGLEVRSLEAQLVHADRQLRQKQKTKEKALKGGDAVREVSSKLVISENPTVSEIQLKQCSVKVDMVDDERNQEESNEDTTKGTILAEHDVSQTSMVSEGNLKKGSERTDQENAEVTRRADHKTREKQSNRLRRRSTLYQTQGNNEMSMDEKRRSTVGGTFFVIDKCTTEDEPKLFDYDYDWDRIVELKRRNATCLPHIRSSYPVETQVRAEDEVEEEELKSGHSTSSISRKRLRDNASDSNLSVTFHIPNDTKTRTNRALKKSQSDNLIALKDCRISNQLSKKKDELDLLKFETTDENCDLLSSTFSLDQSTCSNNIVAQCENIAFNVELSPPKKSRRTFQRNTTIRRSFAKSDLSLHENNKNLSVNRKARFHECLKKVSRKPPSTTKSGKKPLNTAD